MTQYHSFRINPTNEKTTNSPSSSVQESNSSRIQFCYYSEINLIKDPSNQSINATNPIQLPGIQELDSMLKSPLSSEALWMSPKPTEEAAKLAPILPASTSTSFIVEQNNRHPLKRLGSPVEATKRSSKYKTSANQQCHSCYSTETPEWRKGPLGPRTLCNACGLIWKKLCKQGKEEGEERKTDDSQVVIQHQGATLPSPPQHPQIVDTASNTRQKHELSFLLIP